jgi:hypothetical protein
MEIQITKSSRRNFIAHRFGRAMTLCLLSKYGFEECKELTDGIDLVATNPRTSEHVAILVNARTRVDSQADASLHVARDELKGFRSLCESGGFCEVA